MSPSVTERIGNNRNNCEDNLREDGSQPRAGFRRASWRGVLLMLFFRLFMLFQSTTITAAIISNFANTNLSAIQNFATGRAPRARRAIPSRTETQRRSRQLHGWDSQNRTPAEQHHQRRNPLRSNPLPPLMASSICSAIRTAFVLLL